MIVNTVNENFMNRWIKDCIENIKNHWILFSCIFIFFLNIAILPSASLYLISGIFCGLLAIRVLQENIKKNLSLDDHLDLLFKNFKSFLSYLMENKIFYFVMLGIVVLIDLKFKSFQEGYLLFKFSLICIFAFNAIPISNFGIFHFMLNYDLNISKENRDSLIQDALRKNFHIRKYFSAFILMSTLICIITPLLTPFIMVFTLSQIHSCYIEIFFDPKEIEKQKTLLMNT